jgi:hypothetical protein
VGIVLNVDGTEQPATEIINKTVEIIVTVSTTRSIREFLERNWEFLASALAIPLAIWIWEGFRSYRAKRRGQAEAAPKIVVDDQLKVRSR